VSLTPENSPDLPGFLNNLGGGLQTRYARSGASADLEDGIVAYQKAVSLTPENSPDLPGFLNNLGNGLIDRYARSGALPDLEDGISAYRKAVSLTPENSPDLPGFLNNLGTGLTDRYARSGALPDLEAGRDSFQKAAKRGLEIAVEHGLDSATNWLRWAFKREAWEEAEQAYQYVYEAGERLFKIQLLREAKESFLKETQGLAALGAYSLVKMGEGKLQAAVVAIERGQARLMSEALAADRADFRKLEHTEHAGFVTDYRQSIARHQDLIRKMGESDPKDEKRRNQLYDELKQAMVKMDEIIQTIRQIEGYENFLSAPDFPEIQSAAQDQPLVYIMATSAGGLALIIRRKSPEDFSLSPLGRGQGEGWETSITPVWLPELTEKALNETLMGISENKPEESELEKILDEIFEGKSEVLKQNKLTSSYLISYVLWRYTSNPIIPKSVRESIEKNWFAALDNTARWLWDAAMGPIAAEMLKFHFSTPPASPISVTLIPVGRLGLLPLHAAWTPDSAKPTGRRYALDDLLITYSPNALALSKAKAIAERVSWDKLLAVDEPKPQPEGVNPLPNSEYEVATVCSYFSKQNQHVFRHEQAKCDAVLNALNESTVLHFSCHGSADFLEPLNSGLLMANGERLTLKKMLDLRQNSIRLAILSACETGIPDFRKLPDEVVSLSAGMLQAGIGGVMASLWSVYDSSTMMLMAYFYESWRKQGMSPPEALRQAQIWMRDTTNREKQEYFEMKKTNMPQSEIPKMAYPTADYLEQAVMFKPKERHYAHPFHWAGFGYMGV